MKLLIQCDACQYKTANPKRDRERECLCVYMFVCAALHGI